MDAVRPVVVVRAERPATEDLLGGAVEFSVSVPPTPDDRARWAYLAGLPALAGATWTSVVR